jgi:hypothetical protein
MLREVAMLAFLRRVGIGFGTLVAATLVLWLLGGFLPAGLPLWIVAVGLGYLIYRDIIRRDRKHPPLRRGPRLEPTPAADPCRRRGHRLCRAGRAQRDGHRPDPGRSDG